MGVKEDIVVLLDTYLAASSITKDDGSLQASFDVIVANPPHVQVKDWLITKDLFGLFTVDDLRAVNMRLIGTVPIVEDGRYLVKTWTVARSVNDVVLVDGIKLKQKMDNEVKRVFRTQPTDRYVVSWEANDRLVHGTWIHCTIFTVAYMVQIVA